MQNGQQGNRVKRLEKGSGRWSRELSRTISQHLCNNCDTSIQYVQDHYFHLDQKKGGLYFNENGSDKGFGDGGIIAILKGVPDLTSDNLEFI